MGHYGLRHCFVEQTSVNKQHGASHRGGMWQITETPNAKVSGKLQCPHLRSEIRALDPSLVHVTSRCREPRSGNVEERFVGMILRYCVDPVQDRSRKSLRTLSLFDREFPRERGAKRAVMHRHYPPRRSPMRNPHLNPVSK